MWLSFKSKSNPIWNTDKATLWKCPEITNIHLDFCGEPWFEAKQDRCACNLGLLFSSIRFPHRERHCCIHVSHTHTHWRDRRNSLPKANLPCYPMLEWHQMDYRAPQSYLQVAKEFISLINEKTLLMHPSPARCREREAPQTIAISSGWAKQFRTHTSLVENKIRVRRCRGWCSE